MTRGRPDYRALDHTADAAVLVRAADAVALFERTAAAMFDLMADVEAVAELLPDALTEDAATHVVVEAGDRETLLVAFLGELLSLSLLRRTIFAAFEIAALSDTRVEARAWGVGTDDLVDHLHGELKAVTYHELLVSEDADGWSARIVFDV